MVAASPDDRTHGSAMMPLQARYSMTAWEAGVFSARRALANADFKGSRRLRKMLARYLPSRDVICATNYGFRLIVNPQMDPYQNTIFESGTYEPGTLALMAHVLRPGDTFLDVGANIGLMSIAASRHVGPTGRVFAFEPEPAMFARLLENLDLNAVRNVDAIQTALGARDQVRTVFAYPAINIGRASLVQSPGAVPTGQATVRALASFVEERQLDRIRMIKIDVEGFEYEVLLGAQNCLTGERPPILCVECDDEMPRPDRTVSMSTIHELIIGIRQYRPYALTRSKFAKDPRMMPVDDIGSVRRHDNIIYVPTYMKAELPAFLFT